MVFRYSFKDFLSFHLPQSTHILTTVLPTSGNANYRNTSLQPISTKSYTFLSSSLHPHTFATSKILIKTFTSKAASIAFFSFMN